MVVPGWKVLWELDSNASQHEECGRIKSYYDPIKKLYYDEDLNDDDPYLTLKIQRRLEQKKRAWKNLSAKFQVHCCSMATHLSFAAKRTRKIEAKKKKTGPFI
jgi:hypothetical protein